MRGLISRLRNLAKSMRLGEQPTILVSYLFGVLDTEQSLTTSKGIGLVGGSLLLISIAAFIANEYSDKDTDLWRSDREPSKVVGRDALYLASFFSTTGLILGLLGGAYLCATATWTLAILYSAPKPRLKSRPIWDIASLALCFVILPYLSPLEIRLRGDFNDAPLPSILSLLFLLLFLGACNALAMARDIEADRKARLKNTSVAMGMRRFLLLGLTLTILACATGILMVYSHQGRWYYIMILFCPILSSIFGYGIGLQGNEVHTEKLLSGAVKRGILTGNLLLIYLILLAA